jgi:hypothetical protein
MEGCVGNVGNARDGASSQARMAMKLQHGDSWSSTISQLHAEITAWLGTVANYHPHRQCARLGYQLPCSAGLG